MPGVEAGTTTPGMNLSTGVSGEGPYVPGGWYLLENGTDRFVLESGTDLLLKE